VRPGYTSELGQYAREIGLPLLPGVSTGSEIMTANADDYYFLKLFPAVAVGGINLLKGFAGPFADVMFCPTGGVKVESAPEFLALPNVVVCGGTWLTPADAVERKDWVHITKLAKEASAIKPA
jgi:2-dehydro-3-deoxyphosphogluconate aldolase / (4S)-4-hydroxy-2-oxoglutarate aldolase